MPVDVCNVCGVNQSIGIYSVPFIPLSVDYCNVCIASNRHPYSSYVIYLAIRNCISLEKFMSVHEDVKRVILHSSTFHDKSIDCIIKDVLSEIDSHKNYYKVIHKNYSVDK